MAKRTRFTMRCSDADLARADEVWELLRQLGEVDGKPARSVGFNEATKIAIRALRRRVAMENAEVPLL